MLYYKTRVTKISRANTCYTATFALGQQLMANYTTSNYVVDEHRIEEIKSII